MLTILYRSALLSALATMVVTFLAWDGMPAWKWMLPAASAGLFLVAIILLIAVKWQSKDDEEDSMVPALRKGWQWVLTAGATGFIAGLIIAAGEEHRTGVALVLGGISSVSALIGILSIDRWKRMTKRLRDQHGAFRANKMLWVKQILFGIDWLFWGIMVGMPLVSLAINA